MMERIVVLGAGESGVGAALLAKNKGFEVFVSDYGVISPKYQAILKDNNIAYESEKHTEEFILNANTIVKSPGIPDTVKILQKAKAKQILIISEIEFAYRFTKAKFVAITGSNGKTTTTLLTYHLLKEAGFSVGLAGNIGESLAKQVIDDVYEYYVLELSSFQLDNMYEFKADIAILLNITPDHLDRYEYKIENYTASKYRVFQNMTKAEYAISFLEDPILSQTFPSINVNHLGISLQKTVEKGVFVKDKNLIFRINNKQYELSLNAIKLKGVHNLVNSCASILVALTLDISLEKIRTALQSFKNAEHRLEEVATISEVLYVNDSKATNVDAVKYALGSFEKPIIWIAGGVDKGNDYTEIVDLVREKVKAIICLGKDNKALLDFFGDKIFVIEEVDSMTKAITLAKEKAMRGEVVLLSPACASFDLFKNYIDRGEQFKQFVKTLEK